MNSPETQQWQHPTTKELEHMDTPSTTSVEDHHDDDYHLEDHDHAAKRIVKIQSFIRGSLTRARVSLMVAKLIDDLLAQQEQQHEQQQQPHQPPPQQHQDEQHNEGLTVDQTEDPVIEQTEESEAEVATIATAAAVVAAATEQEKKTNEEIINAGSGHMAVDIAAKLEQLSSPKSSPKAVSKTGVALSSSSTSPGPASPTKHHYPVSPTSKPHYFPSSKQQPHFVPYNTAAEWPPKNRVVAPAAEYSTPKPVTTISSTNANKSTPTSFVPPVSASHNAGVPVAKPPTTASVPKAAVATAAASELAPAQAGPPKKESLRERMKRYQAADKTPMGQFGGGGATSAYYGSMPSSSSASKPPTSAPKPPASVAVAASAAAAAPPPPPPQPTTKHEPEPSPAAMISSGPSLADRSKAFGGHILSPKSTATAKKAVSETITVAEEPEKTVSIADRKKGFFKAAYSPKGLRKTVVIPKENNEDKPASTASGSTNAQTKSVLNRYHPTSASTPTAGGSSPNKETKILPAATGLSGSSNHSVTDRFPTVKKPAGSTSSTANEKKPPPSVISRYSPAVTSKKTPEQSNTKPQSHGTGKHSVLDRYHPVSSTSNHNDSSFRSIGSVSNQSIGIIPGKKPTSPKPDDINVKDSAWQAQLSESGVFAGWEHAQEAEIQLLNDNPPAESSLNSLASQSGEPEAPSPPPNQVRRSKEHDFGLRRHLAAYRNAGAAQYDHADGDSSNHNAPSSPTRRSATKLTLSASPQSSNSELARNVHVEVDRRRKTRETYTQPLDTAPEDHAEKRDIVDFLYNFTKTYPSQRDRRKRILEEEFPDSVGRFYKELVLIDDVNTSHNKIKDKDFWQRYFFRCNEDRLLKQAQKRDYQYRVTVGRTARSKLLFNEAGDMVGTNEKENSQLSSSTSQLAPRSILKSNVSNKEDHFAVGLRQLQMIDIEDDDDFDQDGRGPTKQAPLVFEDLDSNDSSSYVPEDSETHGVDNEGIGTSTGAGASGIRFVDDGLNEVREYRADLAAEHTDRLPEWWMETVPYRTLEDVLGVDFIDDAKIDWIDRQVLRSNEDERTSSLNDTLRPKE